MTNSISRKSGLRTKLKQYALLMRLDKPIGIYLVLWPALWSLWLAADGVPSQSNLLIFVLGAVLMRSAGCVINDYADRHVDGHVTRTKKRPIVLGLVAPKEALCLCGALLALAFALVLLTNPLTLKLAFVAAVLALLYPFMKRFTHLPQLFLGAAFAWSIPMAFAAENNSLPHSIWVLYTAVVLWTVAYDTFYAMADRSEDIKIGVRSTAILFGDMDKVIVGTLQVLVVIALLMVGERFELNWPYDVSLLVVIGCFVYQQYIIRDRQPKACMHAFLLNNWVGMAVFIGIVIDKLI